MSQTLEYRRLRAPRENGAKLIEPPLAAVDDLLERNATILARHDYDLQGRSFAQLMRQARDELVRDAWAYTRQYRDVAQPVVDDSTRVLLAGHQPQLFHPGVWFKNFALSELGRRHGAVAVNLVIDSDTIKTASLRVPGGTVWEPLIEMVPFDRPSAEIPFEERAIVDRECLQTFGNRATELIRTLVPHPLVEQFWPLVVERSRDGDNLGQCLAQARHQQEGLWGAATLELPQSRICGLESFNWFAAHLLAHLPRLWESYNSTVAEYRRVNHVRSTAHPVPDLAMESDWLEAPFWIWTTSDPQRRRLFVRQRGDDLLLADRQGLEVVLPLSPEGDAQRAVEVLAELPARGVKLRTRALVTTMFARVLLGDSFVHGIGGAKYDQVTDLLIQRFLGLQPPGYMTMTATLRLPIERPSVSQDDARQIDQQLRELNFHPERFLDASVDGQAPELVETKRRWIATPQTRENAKTRCRSIREVNERLQSWLEPQRQELIERRDSVAQALRGEAILASREYAFCLYPETALRALVDVPA